MERWTQITTWEEFQKDWERTTREAEAVGLLYAGAKLKESGLRTDTEYGHEDHARCFRKKVSFFLWATASGNATIETTARRLIVNELLSESLGLSWTGLIGPSHARIVDFLGTVHDDLRKPPFPRKASDFLFHAFYKWKAKEREEKAPVRYKRELDPARTAAFGADYDRTEPLVKASVAWGVLPNVLVKQWFTPEMLQEIRRVAEPLLIASLDTRDEICAARLSGSLTWAMNEDPPRDLYREEGQTELWKKNGIAVHYLRSV